MLATLAALSTNTEEGKTNVEVDDKQHKHINAISSPYYDLRRVLSYGKRKTKSESNSVTANNNTEAEKLNPFYSYRKILRNQRWKRAWDYGSGYRSDYSQHSGCYWPCLAQIIHSLSNKTKA